MIIFSDNYSIYRIPDSGGTIRAVMTTNVGELLVWPSFLPDGEHFLFLGKREEQQEQSFS